MLMTKTRRASGAGGASILLRVGAEATWPCPGARRRDGGHPGLCLFWLIPTLLFLAPSGASSSPQATPTFSGGPIHSHIAYPTVTKSPSKTCSLSCKCTEDFKVNCLKANLTSVPMDISHRTTNLDLSSNAISNLSENSFSRLRQLQELNLSGNNLTQLSDQIFSDLHRLKILSLQDNQFTEFPIDALKSLPDLETLRLNGNQLESVPTEGLAALPDLKRLWLDGNKLKTVPVEALTMVGALEALNLANNQIREIKNNAFQNLSNLMILVLKNNLIEVIEDEAFLGLLSLKVLEINSNRLTQLPEALEQLTLLRELSFASNMIEKLDDGAFKNNRQLALIEMSGNPILSVGEKTFSNLPNLKTLTLSEVRQLESFLDLKGTSALEHLRLDRGRLNSVPDDLCSHTPHLKSLNLKSNNLIALPNVTSCTQLRLVDFSNNLIPSLENSPFSHQAKLIDLFLSNNLIEIINDETLLGLESLLVLDLNNNKIASISSEAFVPLKELRDLNLANNLFNNLPSKGLQNLRQLKTFNNAQLKEFPPPEAFPRIHSLALSYAYHCCAFQPMMSRPTSRPASMQETIVWLHKDDVDMSVWSTNYTDVWPDYKNFSNKFEDFASDWLKTFGHDYTLPDNLAQYAEEYFEDYKSVYNSEESLLARYPIQCLPEPGPFMPCEDLFGWWTLRCGVWVVFLLAMLGNGVVVVVLMFGRSKMDVPRFLVCNLAMADFFMGIYLGILAVVDASTLGEFKVYAIRWQFSSGCQIAGFLGVLSSELSVYTLSVITLERNYAITHAMHLNKRLSLKHAGYIMSIGWAFALVMSMLPLFGVSDYRKFAICLPFEVHDSGSLAYVVFLILINGVAFLILMGCYLKMYCAIRGSQAWNSNDSRIAKRMALLVFTDFVCWAPIAFFSLTAVCGLQLISLEEAKVFTIFVLPLNSCANPFLYAIFTKQFKKDCVLICKRIEESRVTRGIGRCRHSSNFSNRHTPANTNSAAERKSGGPGISPGGGLAGAGSGSEPTTACICHVPKPMDRRALLRTRRGWKALALRYLLCQDRSGREPESSDYTYAIAQIQKNLEKGHHKRASSISSENFSSRSDSWRQGNVPLRLLERANRRSSWSVTRKQSQDSNLSCSRQDSSTSTFRMSRSSVSSDNNSAAAAAARNPYSHSIRERPATSPLANGCPEPLGSGANASANPNAAATSAGSLVIGVGRGAGMMASLRDKSGFINEGPVARLSRGMMSVSKDKPKLCRQTAVDDGLGLARNSATAVAIHGRGTGLELRPYQKSPPYVGGAVGGTLLVQRGLAGSDLCPACARKETSPPLTFKSKELEEKFTCFYNRLAETSNEESSEVSTSKDDHVLLSTDQSTGDCPGDTPSINADKNNHSTDTTASALTTTTISSLGTQKEESESSNSFLQTVSGPGDSLILIEDNRLMVGPNDSIRTVSPLSQHRLNISHEDFVTLKSSSTTSLQEPSSSGITVEGIGGVGGGSGCCSSSLDKKTVSESSLKKLSLKNLPAAILRSLSSQSPRGIGKNPKLKVRSQTQLQRPDPVELLESGGSTSAVERFPISRSEIALPVLARGSLGTLADFRSVTRRTGVTTFPSTTAVASVKSVAEDSGSDGDDVFLSEEEKQQSQDVARLLLQRDASSAPTSSQSVQSEEKKSVRTSEDAPLMEQQELDLAQRHRMT